MLKSNQIKKKTKKKKEKKKLQCSHFQICSQAPCVSDGGRDVLNHIGSGEKEYGERAGTTVAVQHPAVGPPGDRRISQHCVLASTHIYKKECKGSPWKWDLEHGAPVKTLIQELKTFQSLGPVHPHDAVVAEWVFANHDTYCSVFQTGPDRPKRPLSLDCI